MIHHQKLTIENNSKLFRIEATAECAAFLNIVVASQCKDWPLTFAEKVPYHNYIIINNHITCLTLLRVFSVRLQRKDNVPFHNKVKIEDLDILNPNMLGWVPSANCFACVMLS